MEFSSFGKRFTRPSGARELMDDLGAAMAGEDSVMMLGGGNPAHIPAVLDRFRQRFREILENDREFRRLVADYAPPAGELGFRAALAGLLQREYGWSLGAENIALTGGSQSGFFLLFNLLAGKFEDGSRRQILLPLTPEYAGYAGLGVSGDLFSARKPAIEYLDEHLFKYHVDFDDLRVDESISAICVSRPTNPTGNVLTGEEMRKLAGLARRHQVPLIVDNAYGLPFPQIVFTDARPDWDQNIILCMSLSKIGLPAVRTGIVIARESIIDALTSLNAVVNLAVSSVGAVLLRELVNSGEIIRLSEEFIRPFYQQRVEQAMEWMHGAMQGCDYHIHKPEGALFLWLWLPGLPITSAELYRRLKRRGVFVVAGQHFFPGLSEDWPHRNQCIRVSYARDQETVRRGIRIIGEEVRKAGG
jgi:valine--pyruvate aminotransferase